jgi:hypothetical protein
MESNGRSKQPQNHPLHMASIRRRFPASATGNSPSALDAFRKIRKIDLYRKVPRDLTEGSVTGGLITLAAVLFLLFLTVAELRAVVAVRTETDIVVDKSEDGLLRVNLNVTLLGLACQFVHVESKNALGVRREVDDLTLHKFALDQTSTWAGSATKKEDASANHTYQGTPVDHYGNTRHAIELNAQSFQQALDDYEALLVDFHSPRCIHCVRFAPIYEHAADLVKQRAPKRRDSHKKHAVALATVDCIENFELCRAQHIQAYPTVLVFRTLPGTKRQAAAAAVNSAASQNTEDMDKYWSLKSRQEHRFEMYHGAREAEPLAQFAVKVLEEVIESDETLGKDAFTRVGDGSDVNDDGLQDSVVHTPGCRIEGFLDVRRVPGSIVIRPFSSDAGHELDTGLINVDHRVDHLSFGLKAFQGTDDGAYSHANERPVVVKKEAAKDFFAFRGKQPGETHVHNIKVVSRTLLFLSGRQQQAFEYSIASDSYTPADKIPFVAFQYDLSPLQVRVQEVQRGWIEGITGVLALIGGVFSSSFIIEGVLSAIAAWLSVKDS